MSDQEMRLMLSAMTGETDDDTLSAYLALAGMAVCRRAFPFDGSVTEVPEKYRHVQLEAAAYLLNKRGAEGETVHLENGVHRHYAEAGIPASLLRDVVPAPDVI